MVVPLHVTASSAFDMRLLYNTKPRRSVVLYSTVFFLTPSWLCLLYTDGSYYNAIFLTLHVFVSCIYVRLVLKQLFSSPSRLCLEHIDGSASNSRRHAHDATVSSSHINGNASAARGGVTKHPIGVRNPVAASYYNSFFLKPPCFVS